VHAEGRSFIGAWMARMHALAIRGRCAAGWLVYLIIAALLVALAQSSA
jgi:hypothetical protein